MVKVSHQLQHLAIATILAFFSVNLLSDNRSSANTVTRIERLEPVELYVPPPEQNTTGICSNYIQPVIDKIVERSPFDQGKWGILIQTADGTTLYSRSPDSYLIPASNLKILVTAAALQKLHPQGTIRSSSIQEWINITNLRSNNIYADVLLSYLGGSTSVRQVLTALGVDPKGYHMVDGSGLSRSNLATPRTLVTTLRAMYSSQDKDSFLASLPIAGISGTLQHRLRYTSAEGTVHAKTGTLKGVRALSGYLEHPEYGTLIFSIISNQPNSQSDPALVNAIDEIVIRLSTITSCS
ncbi:peptidase S13 D-Ala-D-Ala carboxypeptidase C [Stanieria cyanosphaera PCC 7437]|uniref:Peptidase S13 D-Ala-D-Ala carboxypeptidase C n=1 Tax=Stanieria cyanosphaera (strain ATCC 29371 / PCC 7437) TaxID=111780 RepID=K9XX41_STAC7|nr:D-alanyl-D-alanine carboxypeptidase/D-alanyl-D-alanine-endopeptidase [Stanieria cyanosphaera]AFZ36624.1 peptidase S13 D-Ala-D-Ala carboxypeptidase C [Stanieria cyanosphaera PCC 7437]